MLATREEISGWRVYRSESTRLTCVISGAEPDGETLALSCKELGCKKAPP